jgi:rhodanese-related sulfurtransferase
MKLKSGYSMIAGMLLALGLASASASAAHAQTSAVDVKQVAALQGRGTLLLDVREPDEYAQGHAPGSILIPLGQLEQRLSELRSHKDKSIALICRSGNRSAQAQKLLIRAGFSTTVNVEGGMIAWQKAGLPVAGGAAAR